MSTLSASARLGVRAFAAARQQSRSPHLAARRLVVSQGERQQQGEAPASPAAAPSPARGGARPSVRVPPQQRRVPPPPPSPYGDNVKVSSIAQMTSGGQCAPWARAEAPPLPARDT